MRNPCLLLRQRLGGHRVDLGSFQNRFKPEDVKFSPNAVFDDPEAEMRRAVDWINEIVDGVEGVTLAVHLCRRNWARRGFTPRKANP